MNATGAEAEASTSAGAEKKEEEAEGVMSDKPEDASPVPAVEASRPIEPEPVSKETPSPSSAPSPSSSSAPSTSAATPPSLLNVLDSASPGASLSRATSVSSAHSYATAADTEAPATPKLGPRSSAGLESTHEDDEEAEEGREVPGTPTMMGRTSLPGSEVPEAKLAVSAGSSS